MNSTSKLLEDSLLLIWNNRNSAERLNLMEKIYARNIEFFENDTGEAFVRFKAIDALIDNLQLNWPHDFEFKLQKFAVNHTIQHAIWTLGSAGQQPVAIGEDIAIIENGKIRSLYLFLDTQNE